MRLPCDFHLGVRESGCFIPPSGRCLCLTPRTIKFAIRSGRSGLLRTSGTPSGAAPDDIPAPCKAILPPLVACVGARARLGPRPCPQRDCLSIGASGVESRRTRPIGIQIRLNAFITGRWLGEFTVDAVVVFDKLSGVFVAGH